jgi:Holliday junction DNA helicase RuvA
MIAALRGLLCEKTPEYVIVEVGGVGYQVYLPLPAFYKIGELGDEVLLRIHTHVRDDALQLYGFKDLPQQQLFEHLISVAGIGPKLAVTILSGMDTDLLIGAIVDADIVRLSTIPGVGKKTAERMALELKEKVDDLVLATAETGLRCVRQDVLSALENLGYRRRNAERALKKVEDPSDQFEDLLKQTLRVLAS